MAQVDEFLILPVSELDELLAKDTRNPNSSCMPPVMQISETLGSIDELGLLSGSPENKTLSSVIPLDQPARFAPLDEQTAISKLDLKTQGQSLVYQLSNHDQLLTATAGPDGKTVFTAEIKPDGYFQFTLNQQIDRHSVPNSVNEENWRQESLSDTAFKMSQLLATQPNMPYLFTLHYTPQAFMHDTSQLQVYWDNQLLQTIQTSQQHAKGYIFSVEGNPHGDSTLLEIIGLEGIGSLTNYLQDITVMSTAQVQLPLDFAVIAENSTQPPLSTTFTINITTTPPIELHNDKHFHIFYEQSVYQTIIVNDENNTSEPLATINLDSLFKQMSIEQENRIVEIIQRTEDGMGTNVYEIQISDKNQPMEPITIADVKLSFPGGNGGLEVFSRTITIDEGNTAGAVPPPLLDMV